MKTPILLDIFSRKKGIPFLNLFMVNRSIVSNVCIRLTSDMYIKSKTSASNDEFSVIIEIGLVIIVEIISIK